jgi:uncharacterized OB-fold protein
VSVCGLGAACPEPFIIAVVVNLTNNGAIAPGDMIKVDKKEYKVGMLVTINVAELRKRLEKDGIIKSMNSFFQKQN